MAKVGAILKLRVIFGNLRLSSIADPGWVATLEITMPQYSAVPGSGSMLACGVFDLNPMDKEDGLRTSTSLFLPSTGSGSGLKDNWIKRLF